MQKQPMKRQKSGKKVPKSSMLSVLRIRHDTQKNVLLLTEEEDVVKFDLDGISVCRSQQEEGTGLNTWVDYFRKDQNDGLHLVTFTQESQDKLLVLTKHHDPEKLTLLPYDISDCQEKNGNKFDITKLCEDNLKRHLFLMDSDRYEESVQFKLLEDEEKRYIHAGQTLFLAYKNVDKSDGSIYRFVMRHKKQHTQELAVL
ncbi:uncharacterized protein LOC133385888 isoform X2 [Rhineura floridana]|uniref:uncharacterized protein LOC133385888 isoform X2 n=1 Tax=Rhineura floridana TaxID=261503 RepID=UPI002AC87C85|nr:uncharacterized protein LOC133385888 isoform X2 [Rhineura floridana]